MERKFDVIVDSACDMTEEFLKEHNVVCVRLGFTMDNENYEGECGERIDAETFYAKLRAGAMPTTYQVTGETAKTYMEESLKKGRDVLVIAFSSALSGTAGSFVVAKRELEKQYPDRKIFALDTLCASLGQGLLVYYAVKMKYDGADIETVRDFVEENKLKLCHWFTVDDLFFLKRGGRINTATAIVGSMLSIKPVLHVDNKGRLINVTKARGRKAAIDALFDKMKQTAIDPEEQTVFISHGDVEEDAEYLAQRIKTELGVKEVKIGYVGPVIGAHTGPGVLVVFFMGSHR